MVAVVELFTWEVVVILGLNVIAWTSVLSVKGLLGMPDQNFVDVYLETAVTKFFIKSPQK